MGIKKFVKLLTLSKILSEQQIVELLSRFEEERKEIRNQDDVTDQFCRFLISTKSVTEWQCNKLKEGKWKGCYLDDYLRLEPIGKDKTTYKARDTRDGSFVVLVIKPVNLTGGKLEYRVDPYVE